METTLGANLRIVDTHCHLWKLELAEQTGLTEDFGPIFRTFEPSDLLQETSACDVDMCVLIESGKTVEEIRVMEKMAASSSLIAAIAPYVDLESPFLEQELDSWLDNPKFRGVRARFEGHPDLDILTKPAIVNGLRKVAERGLIFEFLVRTIHLQGILRIYERIPELKAVIEHMAKPDLTAGTDRVQWHSSMQALAQHTPVACKLSLSPRVEQFGELLQNPDRSWPVESIKPYVRSLMKYFGPDRLMWGSDWPVTLVMSSYKETLNGMRTAIGTIPRSTEKQIFRTTALQFYGLEDDLDAQPASLNAR